MGDTVTRLDRYEPGLGLVLSADLRDTTSPLAMAHLVRRITTGDLLQILSLPAGRRSSSLRILTAANTQHRPSVGMRLSSLK
jgi:hypothetical protein